MPSKNSVKWKVMASIREREERGDIAEGVQILLKGGSGILQCTYFLRF
jgi:hypothetical protein